MSYELEDVIIKADLIQVYLAEKYKKKCNEIGKRVKH